jgi:phage shock protein B
MNITAIAIVALVCWAIVELVNGPKGKKKDKKDTAQVNQTHELEREVEAMRERIETLEKIVTDEKYDLNRQFDDLKKDKVA